MEKDRKPGQNGKGSESRISDKKKFDENFDQIKWKKSGDEKGKKTK